MGIPNITTNLSGFGCFMEDLLETPEDYGCYIVDRRGQGVEESVNELVSNHPQRLTPANYRLTNSSLSPTNPDDNVLTSETERNVSLSYSTGNLSVSNTSKPVNLLYDEHTPIHSMMKNLISLVSSD